jgi:predicted DNA-binding protein with PD1-like motif
MKAFQFVLAVLAALAIVSQAPAEKTQTERLNPTTAAEDAKTNSPDVPEAVAAVGTFKRIFVFRFKYQTDLLAGLEKLVREQKIQNAVILSGIGALRDYHVHAVSNRTFPSRNVFTKDTDSPQDLVNINGYVIGGRVHAHVTLVDAKQAFGGHLEPDTHVFTFAIVTLAELSDDMDVSRFDDKTYR